MTKFCSQCGGRLDGQGDSSDQCYCGEAALANGITLPDLDYLGNDAVCCGDPGDCSEMCHVREVFMAQGSPPKVPWKLTDSDLEFLKGAQIKAEDN